ncbi:hypothetical protein EVA_21441, partial [gut metagenome]
GSFKLPLTVVEEFLVNPFTNSHEKFRTKDGLLLEILQSDKVLHVEIFPYAKNSSFVAASKHVLDDIVDVAISGLYVS